ncbi:uncharacterized protein VTP21DRAFT_1276 [Calcarisporiella thermophila]|uniref:uncharacterized protein n=1 Tax=Calcarisporiella thermophila TaxID=911321 RepID=UPI0037420E4A
MKFFIVVISAVVSMAASAMALPPHGNYVVYQKARRDEVDEILAESNDLIQRGLENGDEVEDVDELEKKVRLQIQFINKVETFIGAEPTGTLKQKISNAREIAKDISKKIDKMKEDKEGGSSSPLSFFKDAYDKLKKYNPLTMFKDFLKDKFKKKVEKKKQKWNKFKESLESIKEKFDLFKDIFHRIFKKKKPKKPSETTGPYTTTPYTKKPTTSKPTTSKPTTTGPYTTKKSTTTKRPYTTWPTVRPYRPNIDTASLRDKIMEEIKTLSTDYRSLLQAQATDGM